MTDVDTLYLAVQVSNTELAEMASVPADTLDENDVLATQSCEALRDLFSAIAEAAEFDPARLDLKVRAAGTRAADLYIKLAAALEKAAEGELVGALT